MGTFDILALIVASVVLGSCKFQRVETADLAKIQLIGMSKEKILICLGAPAAVNKVGGTEVWTYG